MTATYRLTFDASGNPTRTKDDFAAAGAPTVDDDFATAGWVVGSLWYVPSTDTLYICEDGTEGTAVWVAISGSVGSIDWGEEADIATLAFDDEVYAGVLDEAARADHIHGMPATPTPQLIVEESGGGSVSDVTQLTVQGFDDVDIVVGTVGTGHATLGITVDVAGPIATHAATSHGGGGIGPILIADDHSTPIVFADILLTEDQDDILYADA